MSAIETLVIHGRRIDAILRGRQMRQEKELHDAYRALLEDDREAFVLALIGRLLLEGALLRVAKDRLQREATTEHRSMANG